MLSRLFQSDSDLVSRALPKMAGVAYLSLREKGFRPNTIVDIGAYHGEWSEQVGSIFPQANVIMIDALEENRPHLAKRGLDFEICTLGHMSGEVRDFSVSDTGSSLYSERSNVPRLSRKVTTQSLDDVLLARNVRDPVFLKLDVQGAELEILKGSERTLAASDVVQLECALLQYNEGAPDFAEVVRFMDERDFKVFDIPSFIRPNGKDLVQLDVLFARKDSQLRPSFFRY